jgi:hypothetical protein
MANDPLGYLAHHVHALSAIDTGCVAGAIGQRRLAALEPSPWRDRARTAVASARAFPSNSRQAPRLTMPVAAPPAIWWRR